jgi:xanthine/uracil/vitamin C permease (AzgA family)
VVLAALGLTMIATLHYRNIKGSILIGVLGTALG